MNKNKEEKNKELGKSLVKLNLFGKKNKDDFKTVSDLSDTHLNKILLKDSFCITETKKKQNINDKDNDILNNTIHINNEKIDNLNDILEYIKNERYDKEFFEKNEEDIKKCEELVSEIYKNFFEINSESKKKEFLSENQQFFYDKNGEKCRKYKNYLKVANKM